MIRTALTILLPLATPFLIYYALIAWRVTTGRPSMVEGDVRRHPWFFLTMAGIGLSILSLLAMGFGLFDQGSNHPFAAPRLIDGKIVQDGMPPTK